MSGSFQLEVWRGAGWAVDSVFDRRDAAVLKARDLELCAPDLVLRVVEESHDPAAGQVNSAIVYQSRCPVEEWQRLEADYREALRIADVDRHHAAPAIAQVPRYENRRVTPGALAMLGLTVSSVIVAVVCALF